MRRWRGWYTALMLCLPLPAAAQQANPAPESYRQKALEAAVLLEGLIRLDVNVTDRNGAPVPNLKRTDFTLLDNGHPTKIVAFRPASSLYPPPEPPTSVIILIDTLDLEPYLANLERNQVAGFLRRNEGHLTQPVTLYSLDNKGLALQAGPSRDGNVLAKAVESGATLRLLFGGPGSNANDLDKDYRQFAPITGIRALGSIAAKQSIIPGRKLLLWVGAGFRHGGSGSYVDAAFQVGQKDAVTLNTRTEKSRRFLLAKVQWLSNCLRQARITLNTFSVGEDETSIINIQDPHLPQPSAGSIVKPNPTGLIQVYAKDAWKLYLDIVPSFEHVGIMAVYKKTLAVQSGGRVLPASDDLSGQIESCIREADSYYTLTFDPPQTTKPDDYHSLQIGFSEPGYTAQLRTGYYNQPFFGDPGPTLRPVNAVQFENAVTNLIVRTAPPPSLWQETTSLQLTERIDDRRGTALLNHFRGGAADTIRAALDQAAFLPPSPAEILPDPPPDPETAQHILATASDYLSHIIPKLPDFLANRTTILLDQGFSNRDPSAAAFEAAPFHTTETFSGTVTYRDGKEVVTGERPRGSASADYHSIYGIFGPFLSNTVRVALDLPGSVTWSRWEQGHDHKLAVFRFVVPFDKATYYRVSGCCLPGTGEAYGMMPGYHGEITIDPTSGAILRVQVQTELPGFVPTNRSDVMVTYGPVNMGNRTYVVPLRAIAIHRGRSMLSQKQEDWNASVQAWGPFDTQISEFTFDHYHLYQGEARILPGFKTVPQDDSSPSSIPGSQKH